MARTAPPSTRELDSRNPSLNPSLDPKAAIPPQEAIARLAYRYWLERGDAGEGSAEEDWLRAERDLREPKSSRS